MTGGLSFSALQRAGSPVRLWQPLTRHPDALRAEVRDGSGILPVQRSAGREDDCGRGLAIIVALAEYWTPGRAPRGGKWARACMSGGNGLFDGGR